SDLPEWTHTDKSRPASDSEHRNAFRCHAGLCQGTPFFQNSMNSVAIIGGGITGLTAAFRLRNKGVPVTLYEASERVGGVVQSIRRDGYLAECGPNALLETSPKIPALIRDVGLTEQLLYSDARAEKRFIVRAGK